MEQLLDVAVDNALRYAGDGVTVTLSTAAGTHTVDLIVSDDGRGLPAEDRASATARFWRGRDDSAGTGLGLAIAAEIAAGHGGTILGGAGPGGRIAHPVPLAFAGSAAVLSRRTFLLDGSGIRRRVRFPARDTRSPTTRRG